MNFSPAPELWNPTFKKWFSENPARVNVGRTEAQRQRDYLPWRNIRYAHPKTYPADVWWSLLLLARNPMPISDTLVGKNGMPFLYANTSEVQRLLHEIDQNAGFAISSESPMSKQNFSDMRRNYLQQSQVMEAISSSQMEGAATTRAVARQMLAECRPPSTPSEQMIVNNYATISALEDWKTEPLTQELLFRIHRTLTRGTLAQGQQGRYRRPQEDIRVMSPTGETVYLPPPAEHLPHRLETLMAFANQPNAERVPFLHPVLKAILLHTLFAYEHPFCDGNGRTARALFYWSLLRDGYWLSPYISISHELSKDRKAYDRAYLDMESCHLDTTYCLLVNLRAFAAGIHHLHAHILRENERTAQTRLRFGKQLNPRQLALLEHTLRHENHHYTISEHLRWHGITLNTARADLTDLVAKGYLLSRKVGRSLYFTDTGLFRRLMEPR